MITEDKITEYIWCDGDIDAYRCSGRPQFKIINDQEWYLIDKIITRMRLISTGDAPKKYETELENDKAEIDSPKTYRILHEYAMGNLKVAAPLFGPSAPMPLSVSDPGKVALKRHWLLKLVGWTIAFLPLWHFIYFLEDSRLDGSMGNDESFHRCLLISLFVGLPLWISCVIPAPWSLRRKCITPLLYLIIYAVQFIPRVLLQFLYVFYSYPFP
jgi:hypothetical protein